MKLVQENESVYITATHWHRLENPGKVPLEIIEVQLGTYLGEDDIIRADDVYNRAPFASDCLPESAKARVLARRRVTRGWPRLLPTRRCRALV